MCPLSIGSFYLTYIDQVGGTTEEGMDLPSSLLHTSMHGSGFGCFHMELEAEANHWKAELRNEEKPYPNNTFEP